MMHLYTTSAMFPPTSSEPGMSSSRSTAAASGDDARWEAIVRRDRAADGTFVYAVKTTGVYCRPSCPSRRAHRGNVTFHPTCAAAEKAGFRPCKRCQPDRRSLQEQYAARIARACRTIEQSDSKLSLDSLARSAGLSRYHFHRIFKAVTGLTPRAYATARRHERARTELGKPGTVTQAIYDAGFNSNAPFYAQSRDALGMQPRKFRAGGADATIRFAVGQCSLGAILVAATDQGVCAILLGDEPEPLVADLERRFPRAELIGGDAQFEQLIAQVVGFVEQPAIGLDLPLDIRGTAFQQRVWQALRKIPSGSQVSYAEIARRIGHPGAVRAVAQACGANAIAVAIPCHRVIRMDGALSGYRWGIERKRALLERERNDR